MIVQGNFIMATKFTKIGYFLSTSSESAKFIPWKLHIYYPTQNCSKEELKHFYSYVLEFIEANWDCCYKVINPELKDSVPKDQAGKAITIYPESKEQFIEMVQYLDKFFPENLYTDSEISGDRPVGKSGVLFYRYDLSSGAHKDLVIELSNHEAYALYLRHYEPNRGGENYMASDMSYRDDILYGVSI